ncbi:HAD-IA family hydrolase [Flavobacteriaceae bacterium R38]|nr:HAD-IA family hydrolase [Flavobacteriaceae bacterium R38]
MKYKTLILDFDGTLADTKKSILQAMRFVADNLGVEEFDENLIKSLIGLPLKTTFEKVFSFNDEQIRHATLIYRKYYNQTIIDTISLFDDVKDRLFDFHQQGIKLAVASSKGKEALIRILKKQDVYDLFSFVGGEEDVKRKKPSPDIVNLIIDKFNLQRDECLVVGDTVFDIEMGQRAHVATCGVTYGNNSREDLEKQNPNYIIDSFKALTEII